MDAPAQQHQYSIHYLRALAALMVVACHCFGYGIVPVADMRAVEWLRHGVAIFFVISGFVMVVSTTGRDIGAGEFLMRRLIRIVPLYWLATLAWGLLWSDLAPDRLIPSLAFVFLLDPVLPMARPPVLAVGWSLNFEMFFYLIFAAALFVPQQWRLYAACAMLLAYAALASLLPLPPQAAFLANPLLALFAGGMAMAHFNLRLPVICAPLGLAMMALVPYATDSVVAAVLVPAMLIVLGARSLDGRLPHWKLPALLGDASYSIYLTHIFVMQFIAWYVAPHLPGVALVPLAIVAASVFGVAVYRMVELPITSFLRAALRARRQRLALSEQAA
ncbi:acyltransferase family protein [Alteraurantiacibacter aestuarii]|uniref:Acyltransferase family protein n=1 Tax=Alteraurantiacibacter aestuarii TaxID=650004 RepID=A0A844ZKK4_9SPHN|nr:acyltransferase [Alteraurantiacibacter aestuarii]MXO88335.1 acyltransferase family protein [Alteraurantiacibacter aestuarii]